MSHLYVEDVLRIAAAEIGYHEKDSDANLDSKTAPNDGNGNHTKYARDLHAAGYYNGDKCGYAWCDAFYDWCLYQAAGRDGAYAQKAQCQTGDCGAGCWYSAQYYMAQGRFYTTGPKPGDQIFFNDFEHTGLVERVEGTVITTIEGNTGNAVARRTYQIGSKSIDGFGRPRYDSKPVDIGEGHEYSRDARAWAVENGIIEGVGKNADGSTNFAWDRCPTREELITILYRMMNKS